MVTITFVVDNMPPWKQVWADEAERKRQVERKESLQKRAKKAFRVGTLLASPCSVSIRYSRSEGRSDSANIIGGVLDSLQNIVFKNDNQVIEIHYIEWPGDRDWYQVTVTELTRVRT